MKPKFNSKKSCNTYVHVRQFDSIGNALGSNSKNSGNIRQDANVIFFSYQSLVAKSFKRLIINNVWGGMQ